MSGHQSLRVRVGRKVRVLEGRLGYLRRIIESNGSGGVSFAKAEASALRFAIETIRERYKLEDVAYFNT